MRTSRSSIPVVVLELDLIEGRELVHLLRMQKNSLQEGSATGSMIAEHIDFIDDLCVKIEQFTDRMAEELTR